jgi:hypothetical protein
MQAGYQAAGARELFVKFIAILEGKLTYMGKSHENPPAM